MLYFIYENDNLIEFKYNDDKYYYIKNIQEDIIGIMDNTLQQVVSYEYDSWGNILSIKDNNNNDVSNDLTHIANINPFRYRSYYYDIETKLYYLNSRYYNPEWGRFINADSLISSNMNKIWFNMYTYSDNNFINVKDFGGLWPKWINDIGNGVKKIASNISNAVKNVYNEAKNKFDTVINKISNFASNTYKNIKNNFVVEGGVGVGASASISVMDIDTKIGGYQDTSWGIKKEENYSNINGDFSVDIGGFGISEEYTHDYPLNKIEKCLINDPYDINSVVKCPSTIKSFGMDTPMSSFSNNTIFIGISADIHLIIGGHVKIGWEINY